MSDDSDNGFTCDCQTGFFGDKCEHGKLVSSILENSKICTKIPLDISNQFCA